MACRVWSRVVAASAWPPPGISVHRPAPKSAPDRTVYAVIPTRMNTIGTSASIAGPRRLVPGRERHPAEPAEQPEHRARQPEVDDAQGPVADRDLVRPGDGRIDAHDLVHDPRLPSDLGGDPAGDERDHRSRAGQHHRPVEPPGFRQPAPAEPDEQV